MIIQTTLTVNRYNLHHTSNFSVRISAPLSWLDYFANYQMGSFLTPLSNHGHLQQTMMQSNVQLFLLKKKSRAFSITCSFTKVQFAGTLEIPIHAEESHDFRNVLQSQPSIGSSLKQTNSQKISADNNQKYLVHGFNDGSHKKAETDFDNVKSTAEEDYREKERRRKIGLANRGKTPWNKGRRHSPETRALIKQRTLEAMRDPKIRKKMSECPRAHSAQSKARIGLSQRRVWRERLRWKRLQENCYLKWAESIAEEARQGGLDQQELDWDSYEKMKAEIASQQLQWAADKAKAKEIAKVQDERAAKAKAEKKARLVQEHEEREQKAKTREIKRKAQEKSEEEKEDLVISKALKLKEKLAKIDYKSMVDIIASQGKKANGPAVEDWDLDFIKRAKMQRHISLADQILAAKKKKVKPASKEALKTSSSDSWLEVRTRQSLA